MAAADRLGTIIISHSKALFERNTASEHSHITNLGRAVSDPIGHSIGHNNKNHTHANPIKQQII